MNRSEHPFRKCLECDHIRQCPEPEVVQDGWGSTLPHKECPKKDIIIKTCSAKAKEYYNRTK